MSVTALSGIYVACLDLPDVYYCSEGDICCLLRLACCLLLHRGGYLLPAETCLRSVTAQREISVAC